MPPFIDRFLPITDCLNLITTFFIIQFLFYKLYRACFVPIIFRQKSLLNRVTFADKCHSIKKEPASGSFFVCLLLRVHSAGVRTLQAFFSAGSNSGFFIFNDFNNCRNNHGGKNQKSNYCNPVLLNKAEHIHISFQKIIKCLYLTKR